MNVKFEIQFINSRWQGAGAVTKNGVIRINLNLCRNPIVFFSVFPHEVAHWLLDAIGYSYSGRAHYWLDFLHSYVGIYGRKVNRDVYAYHPSKNAWLGFLGTTKQFNEWRKKMIAWIEKNEK